MTLNYTEHLPTLASTVTGCVFTSTFAPLVGIAIGTMISAVRIKICTITAGIKKSLIKNKKKHKKSIVSKKLS